VSPQAFTTALNKGKQDAEQAVDASTLFGSDTAVMQLVVFVRTAVTITQSDTVVLLVLLPFTILLD